MLTFVVFQQVFFFPLIYRHSSAYTTFLSVSVLVSAGICMIMSGVEMLKVGVPQMPISRIVQPHSDTAILCFELLCV